MTYSTTSISYIEHERPVTPSDFKSFSDNFRISPSSTSYSDQVFFHIPNSNNFSYESSKITPVSNVQKSFKVADIPFYEDNTSIADAIFKIAAMNAEIIIACNQAALSAKKIAEVSKLKKNQGLFDTSMNIFYSAIEASELSLSLINLINKYCLVILKKETNDISKEDCDAVLHGKFIGQLISSEKSIRTKVNELGCVILLIDKDPTKEQNAARAAIEEANQLVSEIKVLMDAIRSCRVDIVKTEEQTKLSTRRSSIGSLGRLADLAFQESRNLAETDRSHLAQNSHERKSNCCAIL